MVGICWFMYAIMHAHASGLLGTFQAESPKIALPMRSSFAVRGWRREISIAVGQRGRTGQRVRVNVPDANKLGQRIVRNLDT